jgi:hypothetical protein
MAYVDHAFSVTNDDDLVGGAVGGPREASWPHTASAATVPMVRHKPAEPDWDSILIAVKVGSFLLL